MKLSGTRGKCAETGRQRNLSRGGLERRASNNAANPFGFASYRRRVTTGKQDQEFFASDSPRDIVDADGRKNPQRGLAQYIVSRLLPQRIIDVFETVEVNENQAKRLALAICAA